MDFQGLKKIRKKIKCILQSGEKTKGKMKSAYFEVNSNTFWES